LSRVLDEAFDNRLKLEERAVMPLAGGIMQHGFQCGMIWGAALAAGAQAYEAFGAGAKAETMAVTAAQRLVETFRKLNKHIDCTDITHISKSSSTMEMITFFLLKGGTIHCFRMAAKYARAAFDDINAALSDTSVKSTARPVSCAAELARKLGATEQQTAMAAGLAGGIGLCGGACGALGAAIWMLGLDTDKPDAKVDFQNPEALRLIERFLQTTDHEFECSKIVGREFESVEDHAEYLRSGGCSEIIETLTGS
jgi:hypothetical protein